MWPRTSDQAGLQGSRDRGSAPRPRGPPASMLPWPALARPHPCCPPALHVLCCPHTGPGPAARPRPRHAPAPRARTGRTHTPAHAVHTASARLWAGLPARQKPKAIMPIAQPKISTEQLKLTFGAEHTL